MKLESKYKWFSFRINRGPYRFCLDMGSWSISKTRKNWVNPAIATNTAYGKCNAVSAYPSIVQELSPSKVVSPDTQMDVW